MEILKDIRAIGTRKAKSFLIFFDELDSAVSRSHISGSRLVGLILIRV
jgi:hypothetical protein